jgi:hypothetical protein
MKKRRAKPIEYPLIVLGMLLARSDIAWAGGFLLKALRFLWHDRPVRTEQATTAGEPVPGGPFRMARREQVGDLLLWVPRGIDSYLIDGLTGGYGYSHTTIDTGEIDVPSGKPVMAEITVGQRVTRKFQDQYKKRAFVRVPLAKTGMDLRQLAECVNSKMGEKYDVLDVITLGEIDDPAREVCSGLVADCLPEDAVRRIAQAKRLGLLHRGSVSVHSRAKALKTKAFVSPNGFAEYYGAPRGSRVSRPNTLIEPEPLKITIDQVTAAAVKRHAWKAAVGLLALLALGLVVMRRANPKGD